MLRTLSAPTKQSTGIISATAVREFHSSPLHSTPVTYSRTCRASTLARVHSSSDRPASPADVLAFETYATGQHSDTTTADILNRAGHKPSGRAKSGLWTRERVRYLLTNPFYAGKVRYGDTLYPGQHEALISQELFDEVQAIRTRRNLSRGGRRRSDRVYLLAGVAVCSECGLRLVSQTSTKAGRKDIPQYLCPSRRRAIQCNARKHLTRGDVIDQQVGELIKRLQLPEERERLEELAEHKEEKQDIEGERRKLRGKLRRLREVYVDGDLSRGEYDRRRAELQAEIDALREPEAPQVEEAGATLESLSDAWEGATVQLRAAVLKTIFESVVVDVTDRRVVCVKPYPQFAPLFRMDGLREHGGCFYVAKEEQEAGPTD